MATNRYSAEMMFIDLPVEAQVYELCDDEGGLKVHVAPQLGGELSSLQYRWQDEWLELLYRADDFSPPDGWQGRAPFLWPAVGRSFTRQQIRDAEKAGEEPEECRYLLQNQEYSMPCHGFLMNQELDVAATEATETGASVSCTFNSEQAPFVGYPFAWFLEIEYRLENGRLDILTTVHSSPQNAGRMPFCIGNHLSLCFPFTSGGNWDEGMLKGDATLEYGLTPFSLLDGKSSPRDFRDSVSLKDEALCNMVTGGFDMDCTLTLLEPGTFGVKVGQSCFGEADSGDHRFFVLWGEKSECYFCPEPWLGRPNALNTGYGLIRLGAGESFTWIISLEFVDA